MPKREKEKKSETATVVAPSLVEKERALEVFLIDYTEADVVAGVMVLLRINNEQHCITLQDAVKEAEARAGPPVPDGQAPSPPPLLPLTRQLVQVGDAAVRDTLLNHRDANRIDIYSQPPPAVGGGDGGGGRRPSRAGDKKGKPPAAGGAKGKTPVATGSHVTPPENARCIGGAPLSLIPLLTSTSLEVTIPLSFHGAGGKGLRFRVCCRDAPLLTAEGVLQCRPVVLRVGSVEGLQTMPAGAGSAAKDRAVAATASPRLLRARVQLGDVCVLSPPLSVMVPSPPAAATPPMLTSLTSLTSLTTHSMASRSVSKPEAPLYYHEHVLFLSAMGTPLEVYRQLYARPCEVSLWQSFNTGADEEMATSPLKGRYRKGKSETLVGSGGFSVRDFLSDDQLRFSESVQLLPDRSTVNLAGGQTCLTTASSIKVNLDFLQPFPAIEHVDQTGAVLNRRAFLTHAVLRLPYQAPWMVECLALLLQEVTSLPRALEDVQMYTPPPPSPSIDSQENSEKAAPAGRTGTVASSKASTTTGGGGGARASKKSTVAKPEVANAAKGASRAVPPPPPEPSAPPAHRFDAPLQLVTPPGLSGFEVTDGRERVWCLEGTVPEVHHILTKITAFLETHRYTHTATSLLFNAEIFVPARAYLTFPALVTPPAAAGAGPSASTAGSGSGGGGATNSVADAVALEVEPSGTGGRLHRIRLRTPLQALRQTQAHYVRHTLSDECLDCLNSLSALLRATSMREVELRGWLPSATLLIALERSFGQTLEKDDLYGATPLPSPTKEATVTGVTARTSAAAQLSKLVPDREDVGGAAALPSVMDGVPVGSLVSFDGAIKTDDVRRPIPAAARQRFPITSWMMVSGTGEEVLCAFAHNPPTGLVQYHVEGQVVQAASVTLLYVLKCVCLARSFTHSRNAEYELLLRERQRAQQAHLVGKTVLWPAGAGAETTHADVNGHPHHSGGGGGHSSNAAVSVGGKGAPRALAQSSDDEAEGEDWLASDFYDNRGAAPSPLRASPLVRTVAKDRLAEHSRRHGTKERAHLREVPATHSAIPDKELWRLYEDRAPAAAAGAAGSGVGRLPPLHH